MQNNHHKLINDLVKELQNWKKPIRIMEVCGSHTMAIGKFGIRSLLPPSIELISGPGCPVCVTPASVIDALVSLKGVTIATFGDLIRVPGSEMSLEDARAEGLDVKIVYSPLEALKIAKTRETIFVGIGFETTTPGIAYTILEAQKQNLTNFSVLPAFKTVPAALQALLSTKDIAIDSFILPGHVSVIIGSDAYQFLTDDYNIGGVVTGFEPLPILLAIKKMLSQIESGKPQIENCYSEVVSAQGNVSAQQMTDEVLQPQSAWWRGLGEIPDSGLGIREKYSRFDAINKYDLKITNHEIPSACRCGDVLKGFIKPAQCPLFAKTCNPAHPVGPCMVSSEGSCAAYYKYER